MCSQSTGTRWCCIFVILAASILCHWLSFSVHGLPLFSLRVEDGLPLTPHCSGQPWLLAGAQRYHHLVLLVFCFGAHAEGPEREPASLWLSATKLYRSGLACVLSGRSLSLAPSPMQCEFREHMMGKIQYTHLSWLRVSHMHTENKCVALVKFQNTLTQGSAHTAQYIIKSYVL